MSQKVNGLVALKMAALPMFSPYYYAVFDSIGDLKKYGLRGDKKEIPTGFTKLFARPAPSVPRHGFVESIALDCDNLDLAVELFLKAKAADPSSKLIVSPYIEGNISAVCCNGTLVIGPGNDGATSGRDCQVWEVPRLSGLDQLLLNAGITSEPYIEAVCSKKQHSKPVTLVQLRDGPRLPTAMGNFVPQEMTIQHIVTPPADLLEWEKQVRDLPSGSVVWMPGGSLASHAAVHAVLNNIPVVTDKLPPTIGTKLTETSACAQHGNFWGGLYEAFRLTDEDCDLRYAAEFSALMIGIVHGLAELRASATFDFYCGLAAGLVYSLFGEAFKSEVRQMGKVYSYFEHPASKIKCHPGNAEWRSFVSTLADKWYSDDVSPTFGGLPWDESTAVYVELHNAMIAGDPVAVGIVLNRLIHAAHNGGTVCEKTLMLTSIDRISLSPTLGFIAGMQVLAKARIIEASPDGAAFEPITYVRSPRIDCGTNNARLRWPLEREPCQTFEATLRAYLGTRRPAVKKITRKGVTISSFSAEQDVSFDLIGF